MGVHESNGSLARASGMIARLRKATTEWTAHLREGYSERLRKQAVLAGPPSSDKCESVREETTGQANTAEPARDVPFIPDFQLLRRIGQGSYGEVWLARNIVGTYRAVKVVERKAFQDEEAFEREFLGLQQFEPVSREHEGFVAILHVARNRAEGFFYYVMELADNDSNGGGIEPETYAPKTLSNELARCERLSVEQAAQLGLSLGQALAELHQRGLVHRDIKPSNIIFVKGYAKLADIGLVAQVGEKARLGTEGYIPPEGPGKPQADLYSLGMVLYEASTGTDRLDYPELPADFNAMPEREAFLKLNAIILKACDSDVRKRYQTATELSNDLTKLGFGTPVPKGRSNFGQLSTILSVVFVSGLASVLAFYLFRSPTTGPVPEKSVAVLRFENLSRDPDNSYFADGIQDEILTRLAKIADLKVISRTSTQQYESKPGNLSEIAKQLGVAHIVEGSVQKSGDAVRVNVQLIKAANDSHLWADTFDRKLTNIFSVESEVAKAIADQLRAKLTGREEQVIVARPTDNPDAHDAYLRGLAYNLKTANSPGNSLGAQKYLREAVRLDPEFALSWALLSYVEARGYLTQTLQPTVALREEARQAAETALTLQPNLGEAVLAKGQYHYACLKDYDTAVRYFEQARQLLPNSSRIPESLAYVARRRGQWDRSESYFNEAERLDPRNVNLLTQHALSYISLRRFPEALRKLDQVLDIMPDDVDTLVNKAAIAQAEGDLPRASALLAPLHPAADDAGALETQVYQAILERHPAPIIPRLKEILTKPDPALGPINGVLRFWLGWAQEVAGDHAAAQETRRQARSELESFLKEQPENYFLIGYLVLTNMGLGDKAAAFKLAERAMATIPIEKDALDGPAPIEILARVSAQ